MSDVNRYYIDDREVTRVEVFNLLRYECGDFLSLVLTVDASRPDMGVWTFFGHLIRRVPSN